MPLNDGVPSSNVCPACGKCNLKLHEVGLNKSRPDDKGKEYNFFSLRDNLFIQPGQQLAADNKENILIAKKQKEYISDEFKQCPDMDEIKDVRMDKVRKPVDKLDNTVDNSCQDLAIDG
jgi:hypothetical protein